MYKKFQINRFDLDTLGILENWSLRRGGCNPRFNCNLNIAKNGGYVHFMSSSSSFKLTTYGQQ